MGLITRIRNAQELKKISNSKIAFVMRNPINLTQEDGGLIYRLKGGPHLFIGQLNFRETNNIYDRYSLSSKEYGYLIKTSEGIKLIVSGSNGNFSNYKHSGGVIVLQDFPKLWKERVLVGSRVYSTLEDMGVTYQDINKLREMVEKVDSNKGFSDKKRQK